MADEALAVSRREPNTTEDATEVARGRGARFVEAISPWFKVVFALSTGAFTGLGIASQYGFPQAEFWRQNAESLARVMFVLAAVVMCGSTLVTLVFEHQVSALKAAKARLEGGSAAAGHLLKVEHDLRQVEGFLLPILVAVSQKHSISVLSLSARLWRTSGSLLTCEASLKFGEDADRPSSDVRWTKGKGVIGACWATGRIKVIEMERVADAAAFAQLPAKNRLNMNWEEWESSYRRTVFAYPIKEVSLPGRPAKFIGCLSICSFDEASVVALKEASEDRSILPMIRLAGDHFAQVLQSAPEPRGLG